MNKILLFIVEGLSDEQSLAPGMEAVIKDSSIKFIVLRSDITSDYNSTKNNIVNKVEKEINIFLIKNPQYNNEDILGVVHITDTDGCFANDSIVFENKNINKNEYYDNKILCKEKSKYLVSKNNKAENLKVLSKVNKIILDNKYIIPYSIYYMSCNLDHVLHNKPNSGIAEKRINSVLFSDENDDPIKFEEFFTKDEIRIKGTYDETWDYIKEDNNSLKRGTNFILCIEKYK